MLRKYIVLTSFYENDSFVWYRIWFSKCIRKMRESSSWRNKEEELKDKRIIVIIVYWKITITPSISSVRRYYRLQAAPLKGKFFQVNFLTLNLWLSSNPINLSSLLRSSFSPLICSVLRTSSRHVIFGV